jgi:hypothetical protein
MLSSIAGHRFTSVSQSLLGQDNLHSSIKASIEKMMAIGVSTQRSAAPRRKREIEYNVAVLMRQLFKSPSEKTTSWWEKSDADFRT